MRRSASRRAPATRPPIAVPASATVFISTDGALSTTSTSTTGFSWVDIVLLVDGSIPSRGSYRRVLVANTGGVTQAQVGYGLATTIALSAGSHTISVATLGANLGGSNAAVGGGDSSALQGELSVVVIKQ